jgi:hypothetical protein
MRCRSNNDWPEPFIIVDYDHISEKSSKKTLKKIKKYLVE